MGVANPVVSREQLIDDSRFERYLEGLLRAIGPAADDGGVSRQIIRGSGRVPERPFSNGRKFEPPGIIILLGNGVQHWIVSDNKSLFDGSCHSVVGPSESAGDSGSVFVGRSPGDHWGGISRRGRRTAFECPLVGCRITLDFGKAERDGGIEPNTAFRCKFQGFDPSRKRVKYLNVERFGLHLTVEKMDCKGYRLYAFRIEYDARFGIRGGRRCCVFETPLAGFDPERKVRKCSGFPDAEL